MRLSKLEEVDMHHQRAMSLPRLRPDKHMVKPASARRMPERVVVNLWSALRSAKDLVAQEIKRAPSNAESFLSKILYGEISDFIKLLKDKEFDIIYLSALSDIIFELGYSYKDVPGSRRIVKVLRSAYDEASEFGG